jgi:hypothetical protein
MLRFAVSAYERGAQRSQSTAKTTNYANTSNGKRHGKPLSVPKARAAL